MSLSNMFNTTNLSGPTDFSLMEGISLNTPSSATTFFSGSLLSPATIPCRDISTPVTSIGSEGDKTGAYAQLWHHYQKSKQEQEKLKKELEYLKETHRKLVESNNVLIATYIELTKRPHAEDNMQPPNLSCAPVLHPPDADREEPCSDTSCSYSKSDFPDINFWTKGDWLNSKNKGKDSSILGTMGSPRGGTRCAQGTNVSMQYLKDVDGEAIDGWLATDIREFARKIWVLFYSEGIALPKWGEATMDLEDRYTSEMERRWPVLRYCENHWKAQRIAIDNYPQWYKTYSKKKSGEEGKKSDKPAPKKRKTILKDNENGQSPPQSKINAGGQTLEDEDEDEHTNARMPFSVGEDDQEDPRGGSSRPQARLLTRRDPLADIFQTSGAMHYHVLDIVPDSGLAPPVGPLPPPTTQIVSSVGPVVARPPTQMQDLVVADPVMPIPLLLRQLPGPGVAPPIVPLPPLFAQMQALGLSPPVAPSRSDTSAPPNGDINAPSSSTTIIAAKKRKYTHTMLLKPGVGISSKNICAMDWPEKHPGGTTGEFNKYWDFKIDPKEKAAYEQREKEESARILVQAKRKTHSLPTRQVAARK